MSNYVVKTQQDCNKALDSLYSRMEAKLKTLEVGQKSEWKNSMTCKINGKTFTTSYNITIFREHGQKGYKGRFQATYEGDSINQQISEVDINGVKTKVWSWIKQWFI